MSDKLRDEVVTWSHGLLDNSRIRQLADCQPADWTTRGLDISRMPRATLCAQFSFFWRHLRDRELSSPRVGNPLVGVSASCPVTVTRTVRRRRISCYRGRANRSLGFTLFASIKQFITFRFRAAEAKCTLITRVCVSVGLPVARRIPTLLHGPGCNLAEW